MSIVKIKQKDLEKIIVEQATRFLNEDRNKTFHNLEDEEEQEYCIRKQGRLKKDNPKIRKSEAKRAFRESKKRNINEGTSNDIIINKWDEFVEINGAEKVCKFVFDALSEDNLCWLLKWALRDEYVPGFDGQIGGVEDYRDINIEESKKRTVAESRCSDENSEEYINSVDYIVDSYINGNLHYAADRIKQLTPREIRELQQAAEEAGYLDKINVFIDKVL